MKIGLINTTIYPVKIPFEGYAGVEKLVSEKAVMLDKLGHEVTVFTCKGSKLPGNIKVIETVPGGINYQYSHEKEQMDIVMEYLKKNPVDILEDNGHQKYSYLHYNTLKELNIKLCSVLHCQCNFQNPPPGVPHMNLIGISNNHCAEASGILGTHLECVYNGIDLNNYTYNENKGDYFLFLSRISRMKGAHECIQACKESGNKLMVAGEDVFVQDPTYVMSIMNSCDGKIVKYLGNVTEQKKRELLSNAKALVLPLLWSEPFGIVAIEALASGTPVITSPRGAMPEIITHKKDGFFCYNIGELKSAMKLINDGELNPKDCLEKAKKFTVEIMTREYLKLYERIVYGNNYW